MENRLRTLLRISLRFLVSVDDCGPEGHGWKSESLNKLIRDIEAEVKEPQDDEISGREAEIDRLRIELQEANSASSILRERSTAYAEYHDAELKKNEVLERKYKELEKAATEIMVYAKKLERERRPEDIGYGETLAALELQIEEIKEKWKIIQ